MVAIQVKITNNRHNYSLSIYLSNKIIQFFVTTQKYNTV